MTPTAQTPRWKSLWFVVLALLTACSVFLLPFLFPTSIPTRSPAYAAGANNKVAELAVILLSLLSTAVALRLKLQPLPVAPSRLPLSWLAAAIAFTTLWQLTLGLAVVRVQTSLSGYGEATYFMDRLHQGIGLHLPLYTQLQFAYGPFLFHLPRLAILALGPLGLSSLTAYVLALALAQIAGLALLFVSIQALPLTLPLKRFAFALLVLGSLSPTLGLNYSLLRFVGPMALVVLLARQPRLPKATLLALLGTLACFSVSPEIGIGACGGVLALGLYRAITASVRWLTLPIAALAATALFATLAGPAYFHELLLAGSGGYDLLLTPEPRTLILLIAAVGLAPIAIARTLQSPQPETPFLIGLYGASLALLPAALARPDAIHQFFFGLGPILIALVSLSSTRSTSARLWLAATLLFVALNFSANLRLYSFQLRILVAENRHPSPPPVDLPTLDRTLAGQPVTLLAGEPWSLAEPLLRTRQLAPSFYRDLSSVWQIPAEQRKLDQLRQSPFALVPSDGMANPSDFFDGPVARWRRLGLPYTQKRPPFTPGLLLDEELRRNWQPIQTLGDYTLYRRLR